MSTATPRTLPITYFRFCAMPADAPNPRGVYRFSMEADASGACGALVYQTDDAVAGDDVAALLTDAYLRGAADARAGLRLSLGLS